MKEKLPSEAGGAEELDGAAGVRAEGMAPETRKLVSLATGFAVILAWATYTFWYAGVSGEAQCRAGRRQLFVAASTVQAEDGPEVLVQIHDRGPGLLVERGVLDRIPTCPQGGSYAIDVADPPASPVVRCTRHGADR